MNISTDYYLKHISLGIEHNDYSMFRYFIDRWFCLKNGYINKNGNPNWHMIINKEYVSKNHKEKNIDTNDNEPFVHKEHIIPLRVISKELIELGKNHSLNDIEVILNKQLHYATILKSEDKILHTSNMPPEYYDAEHELCGDIFARYKVAGIELYKFDKDSNDYIRV